MRNTFAVLVTATVVASGLVLSAPVSAAPIQAAAAPLQAAAKPPRNNGLNEPIYWVHGWQKGDRPSANCATTWNPAINRYRALGARGAQHTVAYYKNDKSCNTRIGSFNNITSIRELGRMLAWDIYNRYSRRNVSVDAVGHSMGGLIIRTAITGTQNRWSGFPPRLYVEDVTTISTPHTGSTPAALCGSGQCAQMKKGSAFLKTLTKNPQSAQGTDWTLIGSGDDDTVNWQSAVSSNSRAAGYIAAGHRVVYISKQGLEHSTIYKKTAGAYKLRYWNFYQNRWINQARGAAPVVVARNANFYWRNW